METNSSIEYTDYRLGYSVIDERTYFYTQRINPNTGLPVDEEFNKIKIDSDGNPIYDENGLYQIETWKTFEEKFNNALNINYEIIVGFIVPNITLLAKVNNNYEEITYNSTKLLFNYIDNHTTNSHISWSSRDDDNQEMRDEIKDELVESILKNMNISFKLIKRKEELRKFWKDATDARVSWIISYYGDLYSKIKEDKNSRTKDFVNQFTRSLSIKENRKIDSVENKLIWSIFGLLSTGFDPLFPLISPTFEVDDSESYRQLCSAIASYCWWILLKKQKDETTPESKEPLDLVAEDSETGPHYERDFSDDMKDTLESNGEREFKFCFNTFHYKDDFGNDKIKVYKQFADSREYKRSLDTAQKVGSWLQKLYEGKINLHSFRLPKTNLSILQYIDALAGRRYSIKEIEVDGEMIQCKKMTTKLLGEFHEARLRELFWSFYKLQQTAGIIPIKEKLPEIEIDA